MILRPPYLGGIFYHYPFLLRCFRQKCTFSEICHIFKPKKAYEQLEHSYLDILFSNLRSLDSQLYKTQVIMIHSYNRLNALSTKGKKKTSISWYPGVGAGGDDLSECPGCDGDDEGQRHHRHHSAVSHTLTTFGHHYL